MARRSKTVIPSSKKEWGLHSDDYSLTSTLSLQFRSHTLNSEGFKKEKSFYNSYRFNDNYRKPIRFLNFNRPKTALYVGEAFSKLSPRRGLQSPISSHSKDPSLRTKDAFPTRVFLTQDARSREATSLSSQPPATAEDIEENTDYDDDDGVERPKPGIEEIKKLLYKRECSKLGITPVGKFLRDDPGKKLSIRYYSLGSVGARALAVPLILDANLTILDLEGNDIGPNGLSSMAEMLGEHCSISTLNLRRNNLGSKGADIICKVLLKNKTITSLNVAANNFLDKDGQVFSLMLKLKMKAAHIFGGQENDNKQRCDVIRILSICKRATYRPFNVSSFYILYNFRFQENRQLTTLDLSDNSLGELSGKALGEAFAQNETLEEVDLQWNKFSGRGAAKLLNGVKENVGLKKLNLSFNSISLGTNKAAGAPLGDALAGNTTLQFLDISGCHLLDLDMISIAKGLKDNDTLEILKISHNLVQVQSASILIKALSKNESSGMKLLDFGESAVEESVMEDVEALQSRNVKVIHGVVHQSETDFDVSRASQRLARKDSQDVSTTGSGEFVDEANEVNGTSDTEET